MSRSLTSLLFYLAAFLLYSQGGQGDWSQLMKEPNRNAPFFHISFSNFNEVEQQIVRRLDQDNLIVTVRDGSRPKAKELTSVNDNWKLNLYEHQMGDTYYIKSTKELLLPELVNLQVISRYRNSYLVQGSLEDVLMLKQNPFVVHISNESSQPSVEARVLDMNLNPNRINKVHHDFPALDGSGMVVSVQENQFRKEDIDIVGRSLATNIESEVVDNHATEMASVIAGAGNSFLTGRGVAKKAFLVSSDFSNVLPDDDTDYQELDIQLQNHSYGTEIESFYGVQAQAFDQSAVNNPTLQHVFSSGNQGFTEGEDGTYAGLEGFANLTGNFKMAKNVLVVGSVDTVGNVVPFTSNGPTYDGRVKPEVVAYSVVGSSNSAALVSGISTLLQHQYRATYLQSMPSSLVRALLINSARDVGPAGLDFKTGFGSVDANRSLKALNEEHFIIGTVSEGEKLVFPLTLPADAINLKVTLSWTDPVSDIASFQALVNDLDLSVLDSPDEMTLPWVLNSGASVAELSEPAVRGVDRLNNNEQVTIAEPDRTNITIEVVGFEVSASQDFAIAYQYDMADTFEWDYPTGSDNMPYNGESGSYFRWKSTLKEMVGRLEYTLDGGVSWEILDAAVDLSKGHRRWTPPFGLNNEARARIVAASGTFETETFTISNPVEISVGFICSDSVRLQWGKVKQAVDYEVYNMGSSYLEFLTNTSDTALIIPDISAFEDTRFAVVPVLVSGKKLIPSLTVDITQQAIECYVLSFFQEVQLDSGMFLNLRLGTNYGIEKITFQRQSVTGFVDVEVIENPSKASFRILDETPNQGNNTHRIIIDFINGEQIQQEAVDTYFLTELPILVFPNPSVVGDDITILTKELVSENPTFVVLDSRGLEVLSVPVRSTQLSVPAFGLKPGMYYYKLVDGTTSYNGRLLIK